GVRIIVVTDGANGVYAATTERIYHSESLRIKNVINTLGAGDAFRSTFCANIYKGCCIEDSIKFALINASHVIQHSDA
ncbi:PfkB family carbohydrate kinase, partial [Francisella tularensis subsp. holarctica]|uniref:carbohydrate kinase family protein n=1 Tax=Francisella tularensis TaxID=263 RepID=UPI002381D0A7